MVLVAEATVAALIDTTFRSCRPAEATALTRPAVALRNNGTAGLILIAVFLITAAPLI
jgi:hypothetical protein